MSRIGKAPITIPAGVEINVDKDNVITVKGKLGTLTQYVDANIKFEHEENTFTLVRGDESKETRSRHGLYRALVANMVKGVSEGYKIVQELVGVGFRATNQGQVLNLTLGYSHHIHFQLPEEVKVETVTEKGKNPMIILTSVDKQLVGQVAAKIRSLRKPEPYKGKGIRYQGEEIRRKAGKTAAS
ncbi:MAG: 50S ribosomal protein L6 [Bacteroidetes bacterium]|nr:MAG: 50S ribosomal protein L6 [Bacteroidota bacterium]